MLLKNAISAKWLIAGGAGVTLIWQQSLRGKLINEDIFGMDGNGGRMLKIITNLTDEEMARLKYVRRLYWHWKGSRKMMTGHDPISNQELGDRGIELP